MQMLLAGGALLGVLIFFHELGHFVVAKLCGVRVLTFSLGFGPRLFGFRIGDTDYRISALPLGGYVRMYGDEVGVEIPDAEKNQSYLHKPIWQRSLIAVAGPVANFILPVVVVFAMVLGPETVNDTVVGTLIPGAPAERAGLLRGDRITAIDGAPTETFSDLQGFVEDAAGRTLQVTVERAGKSLTLDVVPEAIPTPSPIDPDKTTGRIGLMPAIALPHVSVLAQSPAHAAGVATGDRVLAVNGVAVETSHALLAALDAADPAAPLTLKVRTPDPTLAEPPAREVTLDATAARVPALDAVRAAVMASERTSAVADVEAETAAALEAERLAVERRRGLGLYEGTLNQVQPGSAAALAGLAVGERIAVVDGRRLVHAAELSARLQEDPKGIHVLGVVGDAGARVITLRMKAPEERGLEDFRVLGAQAGSAYGPGATVERTVGVGEAFTRAVDKTWTLIRDLTRGLFALLTGQISLKSIGGPITIFDLAGRAIERGVDQYVELLLLISVNLGILNLLPIPVLDGGHLLMFALEAIKRDELSLEARERAVKVGFACLLMLMVVAIFNDILRFV